MSCLSDAELLEEVEREHLEEPHVRGCDPCQLRLAQLRVAARMLRELRGTPAASAFGRWGGRLGLIATAATILAIAGVLVWKEVGRERSRKTALACAPEGDGAYYDGEAIVLTWGDAFGPLGGKEVRLYRRPVGGDETRRRSGPEIRLPDRARRERRERIDSFCDPRCLDGRRPGHGG